MVKAPRKKLVIAVVVLGAAVAVVFAAQPIRDAISFVLLSPTEKKAVGEWKTISIGGPVVTTTHADHTWTSVGGCLDPSPPIRGTWRVEGSDIVYEFDSRQFRDLGTPEPRRERIQQLIDDDREARLWLARNTKK